MGRRERKNIYVYLYINIHIYIHIYINIHIYMYIYTHQTMEDSLSDWETTAWAPESATCPRTDEERSHETSAQSGTLALFVMSCMA